MSELQSRHQMLNELVRQARAKYEAMTPEQKAEHDEAQRQSFVRAMTSRCEHGELDWEQCGECYSASLSLPSPKQ